LFDVMMDRNPFTVGPM